MAAGGRLQSKPSIGRKIGVQCLDNITRVGFLYTMDPLTNALVIVDRVILCSKLDMCVKEPSKFVNSVGPENHDRCEKIDCKHWCMRFEIIMGDAYTKIEDIHGSNDSDDWNFIEKSFMQRLQLCNPIVNTQLDPLELKSRMDLVAGFLKSHHLPLKVEKDVIVLFDGLVKIEPPYISASCFSRNPVVLDKVHKLLEKFSFTETK